MPNTKSAIKAARQNLRHRVANSTTLEKIKKTSKKYKRLISAANLDEAKKTLQEVFSSLDKAAKKNIIHKNKAARLKSRLSKILGKK